jgi:hypothetical protein
LRLIPQPTHDQQVKTLFRNDLSVCEIEILEQPPGEVLFYVGFIS